MQHEEGSRPISRVLSWTAIHLGRASPHASSNLPGNRAGRTIVPLFGLAPDGVYPATPVARRAVRSYRTISPLPAVPSPVAAGGIFSVALSVDSHPPGITWHPALRSPDFPRGKRYRPLRDCLADSRFHYRRSSPARQVFKGFVTKSRNRASPPVFSDARIRMFRHEGGPKMLTYAVSCRTLLWQGIHPAASTS
jgi:hypothetical protein